MLGSRNLLLAILAAGLALAGWAASSALADGPAAPRLTFPFPSDQTWRVTCGYALPDDVEDEDACGHSDGRWSRYALDFQHIDGRDAARGQPVLAAAPGQVFRADWDDGLGWHVLLDHGEGYVTVYGHMEAEPAVEAGEEVREGAVLGQVGCTGRCTGAHIHFALWKDLESVPPEPLCGLAGIEFWQVFSQCATPRHDGADFDGDGRSDVALLSQPEPGHYHLDVSPGGRVADGLETWWFADAPEAPQAVFSADFSGDGRTDVAFLGKEAGCGTAPSVLLAQEDGFADPELWMAAGTCLPEGAQVAAGDFDGDGRTDLAAFWSPEPGHLHLDVLPSDGSGFAAGSEPWWQNDGGWQGQAAHVLPGDFDGDGRSDLAVVFDVSNCVSQVHTFLSTGREFEHAGPAGWFRPVGACSDGISDATSGDFDGDGLADDFAFLYGERPDAASVIVLSYHDEEFSRVGSETWWEEAETEEATVLPFLLPGDFDGDGVTDVILLYDTGECATSVRLLASQGDAFIGLTGKLGQEYCAGDVMQGLP